MTALGLVLVGAIGLMLGHARGVIKRRSPGLESASACPTGRRRPGRCDGEPAPAEAAGGARTEAGPLARCWQQTTLAGVLVRLPVGLSTALALSRWLAPSPLDPAFYAQSLSCSSASFRPVHSGGRPLSFNGSLWNTPQ